MDPTSDDPSKKYGNLQDIVSNFLFNDENSGQFDFHLFS